ncbi:MAG: nucleotidyl transferase AbiEii/AbiGii toxin family protein [Treponema sp.]|nr:nucleotidyl transferase AbiEii/AbiGii toxin family protein [Treponema sp.]
MISPSRYYEESLYPLQDGVLNAINQSGTDFFLTGGTALSRAYYHHRYSDDLDFFVNVQPDYDEQMDLIFGKLRENGFFWNSDSDFIRNKDFISFKVGWDKTDAALKLDFVNDSAPHFGDIVRTGLFDRTDSIRNILSNKLTALFRYAGKDVADIREIALHEAVDWAEIIREAREKEDGLEIPVVAEILTGMPKGEFDAVMWARKPEWEVFRGDIEKIVFDMMSGGPG